MANRFVTQPKFKKAPRLSDQVANFLVSEIRKGTLRAGAKLPPEASLAEQFDVSRTVIREAFARLRRDGLLKSKHGIGATVAQPGNQQAFRLDGLERADPVEIGHLYELRGILEGNAAAFAAERRSQEDVERLSRCLERMAHSVEEGSDGTDPDADFHQILAEASGNPFLRDFMRFLNGKVKGLIQRARTHSSQQPGLPMVVQEEHVAIFEAILKRDPERARDATLTHIKNGANRLGLTVLAYG
ncbi:MAG: FadR family transcriptional regulator [Desulfobacteraceae bacterium]|nr:MAG: FadR family transcriptional regulator [Desulfobacteraceae bacterium]